MLLVSWFLFGNDPVVETTRIEQGSESETVEFEQPNPAEIELLAPAAEEPEVAERVESKAAEPEPPEQVDPQVAVVEPEAGGAEPGDESAAGEAVVQSDVVDPAPDVADVADSAGEVAVVEPEAGGAEPGDESAAGEAVVQSDVVDSAPDVADVADSPGDVAAAEPSVSDSRGVSVDDPAEEEPPAAPDPVSFTLGGGARSGDSLVAVARGRTCAVRLDGGVSCWGEDALRERLSVAGLDDVVTISIGDLPIGAFHACVLHKAGTVSCWGPGAEGQLGQGDTVSHYVPVRVPGIREAVALAAGDSHTCVVHADGGVSCWGANHAGQLGDGTERSSSLPKRVPGLEGVATIAAGPNATCAVHVDGALSCWGLGPASVFTEDHRAPGRIEGVEGVVSVAVGWDRVCAVRNDGEVYCWQNVRGTQPALVQGIGDVAVVSTGAGGVCALHNDGGVSCWGESNATGQLGDGTTASRTRPERVAGIADAVAIAISVGGPDLGQHACVMHGGGSVSCWGSNEAGQLGDGTHETRLVPTAVRPIEPFPADQVPQNQTLFLRAWLDMAVEQQESEFPWMGATWDYVRDRSFAITSGFGGQVHSLCGPIGGSYTCWADRMEITSLHFSIVVHELAHVYSGTTDLVSGEAWGAVQLYFAVTYPDCHTEAGQPPGEEILADTVKSVVMPSASLNYFDAGSCPALPDEPTPEMQQIVRDGLQGEIPGWYRENITNGAELWAALRRAPSAQIIANLANAFSGLCSTDWLTYPLDVNRLPPEGANPFRDGGC